MKIGLIQTRGIGDLVIAAPIAQHFLDDGHEVFWPLDARFVPFAEPAFPGIRFLPVDAAVTGPATLEYFHGAPLRALAEAGCEAVHCLYSFLSGLPVVQEHLARSLKFDEYKYAVAGVPFARKWALRIARDRAREQALSQRLGLRDPYVLVHETGSDYRLHIALPPDIEATHQVVRMEDLTDSPFDWLGALEGAAMLVCVDSVFANLADQLDLCPRKYLFLRSPIQATPVFRSGWQFRRA